MKKHITRRQFIEGSSAAALGSTLLLGSPVELLAQPEKGSRVILVRDPPDQERRPPLVFFRFFGGAP